MKRTNLFIERDRLEALKIVADRENTNVSDLIREGIDIILRERISRPHVREDNVSAKIQRFLEKYARADSDDSDMDELIDRVKARRNAERVRGGINA